MLEAGEDPLFVVRRMIILAAEDVGLADPRALSVAAACQQAVHFIGMPEGFLPMAECASTWRSRPRATPRSRPTRAPARTRAAPRTCPCPMHLRNAPTGLMREMGHGAGYRYAHDEPGHYAADERYLPEELGAARYYEPGALGAEAALAARLERRRADGEARAEADQG